MGQVQSKQLLMQHSHTMEQTGRLQLLGMLLGVNEWTQSFHDRLAFPASCVEEVAAEMENAIEVGYVICFWFTVNHCMFLIMVFRPFFHGRFVKAGFTEKLLSWSAWFLRYTLSIYLFEIKELRNILQVSWTAKKTNEWVLNTTGVKRKLLDSVKARKLAHYVHTMRKQGSCLEKEIMQGTMPFARRQGRPHTAWMDNIKTWTGLPVKESVRMTEDRDKWWKYVHGVANPRIKDS